MCLLSATLTTPQSESLEFLTTSYKPERQVWNYVNADFDKACDLLTGTRFYVMIYIPPCQHGNKKLFLLWRNVYLIPLLMQITTPTHHKSILPLI